MSHSLRRTTHAASEDDELEAYSRLFGTQGTFRSRAGPKRPPRHPKAARAVAEALEQGNLRLVLSRTESLLEAHAGDALLLALRAVALERAGRRQEALAACQLACAAEPTELEVLGHLRTVYHRSGLYPEVSRLYEVAAAADEGCEGASLALFLARVSEGDTVGQQEVALRLHSCFGRPLYLYWSIAAVLLQPLGIGQHASLDLAQRLLQRLPELSGCDGVAGRWEAHRLLLLHLATLRQQGRQAEAAALLAEHRAAVPLPRDEDGLRVRLLSEAGERGALEAARSRWLRRVGHWRSAREYVSLAFQWDGLPLLAPAPLAAAGDPAPRAGGGFAWLAGLAGRLGPPSPLLAAGRGPGLRDARWRQSACGAPAGPEPEPPRQGGGVADAYSLAVHLQSNRDAAATRVPFLAELELRALALACGERECWERAAARRPRADRAVWPVPALSGDLDDLADALAGYFSLFGHSGGCYADLKPYLCLLDAPRAERLLGRLHQLEPLGRSATTAAARGLAADVAERAAEGAVAVIGAAARDEETGGGAAEPEVCRSDAGWVALCEHAQRQVVLARLRRGLCAAEGLGLEGMAREVDGLLRLWGELRPMSANHPTSSEGFCTNGVWEELEPTVDPDDLLLAAAATLLDMDRLFCTQVFPAFSGGEGARFPAVAERVYLLDALVLLELGAKAVPNCARVRLLLAAVYGAAGAGGMLRKWHETIGAGAISGHGALLHASLEGLLALGSWEEVPEACRRLRHLHATFERAARLEPAAACEGGATHGLLRGREVAAALRGLYCSLARRQAVVAEAVLEVHAAGGLVAAAERLEQRAAELQDVAGKPSSSWDCPPAQPSAALRQLYALPRCSPLQAVAMGVVGAGHLALGAPPLALEPLLEQWAAAFRPAVTDAMVTAAPSLWACAWAGQRAPGPKASREAGYTRRAQGSLAAGPCGVEGYPAPPTSRPSALEEVVDPRRVDTASTVRLRALLLLAVRAMLKPEPSAEEISLLLSDAHSETAPEEAARSAWGEEAHWPPPWRPSPTAADSVFWRCALLACDVAHRALSVPAFRGGAAESDYTSAAAGASAVRDAVGPSGAPAAAPAAADWANLRRGLAALRLLVETCGLAILGRTRPAAEEAPGRACGSAFRFGGHGARALASFLAGPALALPAALQAVAQRLPPPRRKARGLDLDPAEASRVLLTELVEDALTLGRELLAELGAACREGFDHVGALPAAGRDQPAPPQLALPRLEFWQACGPGGERPIGIDADKLRRSVLAGLVASHIRQLSSLDRALCGQMELLQGLLASPIRQ